MAAPNLRERAARMLMAATPFSQLGLDDALVVIDAMEPAFVNVGTVLMEEGQTRDTDYMALLLEGDLRAESGVGVPGEEVVMSVLGPGHLIGEMGVLDGSPRSATCIALSDLKLAVLPRQALMGLVESHPAIASRLLLAVCKGMSDRLRESNRRLRLMSQVSRALQLELDAAHSVNRRLLN